MYDVLDGREIIAPPEAVDRGFNGDYCICEYPFIRDSEQRIHLPDNVWSGILADAMISDF